MNPLTFLTCTQAMVQTGRMVAEPGRPEAPARRRSTARSALKSCRSPNRALKLTLFALLERYSTFDRGDRDEMNEMTPTPSGPADEIMDAINRVRVDGKAVVRTERRMDKGKPFYELHYPFAEDNFPGGARTICLALTMRMQQLVGMPVPDDERGGPTEEGVDEKTIGRLAASIEILEPAEVVH